MREVLPPIWWFLDLDHTQSITQLDRKYRPITVRLEEQNNQVDTSMYDKHRSHGREWLPGTGEGTYLLGAVVPLPDHSQPPYTGDKYRQADQSPVDGLSTPHTGSVTGSAPGTLPTRLTRLLCKLPARLQPIREPARPGEGGAFRELSAGGIPCVLKRGGARAAHWGERSVGRRWMEDYKSQPGTRDT